MMTDGRANRYTCPALSIARLQCSLSFQGVLVALSFSASWADCCDCLQIFLMDACRLQCSYP